ncbi:hypothetical protein ZWY2020_009324 [Hordeum vulgare]|nr:hypothetical protein ZWY2020_009324 [Hordeum vulgare]
MGLAPPTAPRASSTNGAPGEESGRVHTPVRWMDLVEEISQMYLAVQSLAGLKRDFLTLQSYKICIEEVMFIPWNLIESLSMNQVLDAHWGVLDDEDVVVWFSTGYITIKDMVVTGTPIKIVGVAALTVLLPTLEDDP